MIEVRCRSVCCVDLNDRRFPWITYRLYWRHDRTWKVRRVVRDRIRIRIWYIHTQWNLVRVVRAPVDDFPVALNFETCIRHYREDLVFVRYAQQFAIFAIECWLTINTGTVASRNDYVIRELHKVILLVCYHYTLRALAAVAVAVKRTECARDRALVAKRIKLCVVHSVCQTTLTLEYFRLVQAAVVIDRSFTVQPKAWVKLLASNRYVRWWNANWLQLVLYFNLDIALVENWRTVCTDGQISVYVRLIHAKRDRLGCTNFAAVELDRILFRDRTLKLTWEVWEYVVARWVTVGRVQAKDTIAVWSLTTNREFHIVALVIRTVVERGCFNPRYTSEGASSEGSRITVRASWSVAVKWIINADGYRGSLVARCNRWYVVTYGQAERAACGVATIVFSHVGNRVGTLWQTWRPAISAQRVKIPVVVAWEVRYTATKRLHASLFARVWVERYDHTRNVVDL